MNSQHTYKGYILGLLSGLFIGLAGVLIHAANGVIPASELIFVRSVIAVGIFVPLAWTELKSIFRSSAWPIWLAAVSSSISISCYFVNLQMVAVGTAKTLANTTLLLVLVFSMVFLKEKFKWQSVMSVIMILLSGTILYSWEIGADRGEAFTIGLTGAFFASIAFVSIKYVSAHYSTATILSLVNLMCILAVAFMPMEGWRVPDQPIMIYTIMGVGVIGTLALYLLIQSKKYLSASVATVLSKGAIVWGVLFSIIWLNEWPAQHEWIAYGSVCMGILLLYPISPSKPLVFNVNFPPMQQNLHKLLLVDSHQRIQSAISRAEKEVACEFRVHIEANATIDASGSASSVLRLFREHKVHQTRRRNGVFLCYFLQSSTLYIVLDKGISRYAQADTFERIMQSVRLKTDPDDITANLAASISQFSVIMAPLIPRTKQEENELPDLVTIATEGM